MRHPVLPLGAAIAAVEAGSVRLLTSDVFDTLVWRPVAEPHDLFLGLAVHLRAGGHLADWVDDRSVAIGRRHAEARARADARREHGRPECTLDEIWAELVTAGWWAHPLAPADGVAAELAVEAAALHRHRGVARLLDAARQRDVPIVLVSDTYFSVAQLTQLLTIAGVDLTGTEVVTSSSRRTGKWDGLLDTIVAEHGGPEGALHVGDNPIADVEVGDRAGVQVCHVDVHPDDDAVALAHEPWERLSAAAGSDAGRTAVVRETLVSAGSLATDPSYQFGVAVAGPIMAGFAGWAADTAAELGADSIHCLLREGARIAELVDVVRPDGPERVLVHASRWGVMRAAVVEGTVVELERALARRADLRAEHVTEAFGCDTLQVARVIGGSAVPRTERVDAYEAIAGDDDLREQILAAAARLRRNALAYYERTLRIDGGPLVLCDIGWGGTIQEGLGDILRAGGHRVELVGLYALLSPPGEGRVGRGSRMLGYLPTIGADGHAAPYASVAVRHPEFLERINTPSIGTLLEFDERGEPVTRPADHDVVGESLRVAQRGVLDLATTLAELALDDPTRRDEWAHEEPVATASLASLAAVVAAPDPRLAAALGTWEHDDVAGTAAEALSDEGFRRWLPYANAVDAAEITMHEVFWVPGAAAAARSSLAHGLAALAEGAHPDALCPPSPTGTARIAVFPPGSELASAQDERVPRLGTAGWMLLRLTTPVPGLRSIRIDLGDTDLLADVADARVVITTPAGDRVLVDDVATLADASTWIGGRWIGHGRAVVSSGGHLLVDLAEDLAPDVSAIEIAIGVRTWPIDPAGRSQLLPRWRVAGEQMLRRAGRKLHAVRRRGRPA